MKSVFLVEDEQVVRDGIRELVHWNELGFKFVGEATDGEMALPRIMSAKPDILLTDIRMPFMTGLELAQIVRKELPQTHIMILSGYDDFQYAQEAMALGVRRYLLKPITCEKLEEALLQTQREMDSSVPLLYSGTMEQNDYRTFFKHLISGTMSARELLSEAKRLQINTSGQRFCVVQVAFDERGDERAFFTAVVAVSDVITDSLTEELPQCRAVQLAYNQIAVLVCNATDDTLKQCVDLLTRCCKMHERDYRWHIAIGGTEPRLSTLHLSFAKSNRALAGRYMCDQNGVVEEAAETDPGINWSEMNVQALNYKTIEKFLRSGQLEEIDDFVEHYIALAGADNMKSLLYRQYVVLHIQHTCLACAEEMGLERMNIEGLSVESAMTEKNIHEYIAELLRHIILMRDESSGRRNNSVIRDVRAYVDAHYMDAAMSLEDVAGIVYLSPAYLSCLFSRETGQTLFDYVMQIRMEKACELLKNRKLKVWEVAERVGYRDAHHFSNMFKKIHGVSPRDYAAGRTNGNENQR